MLRGLLQSKRCVRDAHRPCWHRSFSANAGKSLEDLKQDFHKEIAVLPEQAGMESLESFLAEKRSNNNIRRVTPPVPPRSGYKFTMNQEEIRHTLDAAMATFCLHVESRIAALVGKGFYTIGPCGEEFLSSIGMALEDRDDAALHYRHLGVSLARQLRRRGGEEIDQILLDRARGYTVSKHDPVTGGVHCSIGSHTPGLGRDYVVTSTLASQCPSAVGRALGYSLAARQEVVEKPPKKPLSFVSIGDGSVHNGHFHSAFHLARHARHKSIQCPVVFGISLNGVSISYQTNYVNTMFGNDELVSLFEAQGGDMMDVYSQTKSAAEYARRRSAPAVCLYQNITRRFGHAASDRQQAYLTQEQIHSMAESDILERGIVQAVEVFNACTYPEIRDRFEEIRAHTISAFSQASREEKVTRPEALSALSQPMVPCPRLPSQIVEKQSAVVPPKSKGRSSRPKLEVMRKRMTQVLDESMSLDPSVVYLGEDVEHGGYYLVTDGLAKKFQNRVLDFPPDETSLFGAAMGFSQCGLTPIIEVPYAKYLDCGADMFAEIAISNWLSNGKQPNGMLVRLQGFDRGLFGGNFHTHNSVVIPPGVDMVCFSNGEDYVRGFRNALAQAKAGRVVVSVDSTNLLNLRHLHGKDRAWERAYPKLADDGTDLLGFDEVVRYGTKANAAVVTYGNGVVTALQARRSLMEKAAIQTEEELDIIDCPLLSDTPLALKELLALKQYDHVLFADVCKEGPGSNVMSSMVVGLNKDGILPEDWATVFASRTYNPLGSVETFLNIEDIEAGWHTLMARENSANEPN